MRIDFTGQRVVVTRAGHGIGRRIATAFAERGASVWACGVNNFGLRKTADLMGERGQWRDMDVTDEDAVNAVFSEIVAGGPIDVLVNNAGGVQGQTGESIEKVTDEAWNAIVEVNLTGSFRCARAATIGLKAAGGSIVNISSGAGLGVSLTGIQAYASAKAGQIGLTRQLAHELGPHGVRVNAIAPGLVLSNPDTERQWESYGPEGQAQLLNRIALGRLGTPHDIAYATLFLASDYASWITGEVLQVNGGR